MSDKTTGNTGRVEEAREALAAFDDHGDYEAPIAALRTLVESQPPSPQASRIDRLPTLPNWGSCGEQPPTEEALETLRGFDRALSYVPLSDGGVQIEFHALGLDFEVAIGPEGAVEDYYLQPPRESLRPSSPQAEPQDCETCGGSGLPGFQAMIDAGEPCGECDGTGKQSPAEPQERLVGKQATVRLPECASSGGEPKTEIPFIWGFSPPLVGPTLDELREKALGVLRRAGIKHHGQDLLPDAAAPSIDNWRLDPRPESDVENDFDLRFVPADPQGDWPTVVVRKDITAGPQSGWSLLAPGDPEREDDPHIRRRTYVPLPSEPQGDAVEVLAKALGWDLNEPDAEPGEVRRNIESILSAITPLLRKEAWDQQENRIREYAEANTSQKHRIRELEAQALEIRERLERASAWLRRGLQPRGRPHRSADFPNDPILGPAGDRRDPFAEAQLELLAALGKEDFTDD